MKHIKLFEDKFTLTQLPSGWKIVDSCLTRKFKFKDFVEAFDFMTKVSKLAERLNHHPWWCNVYNEVEIKLSTHEDGNKIAEKDIKMAKIINEIH
jgi:4a-hydroxytetrahydrobiopterin dehydratase